MRRPPQPEDEDTVLEGPPTRAQADLELHAIVAAAEARVAAARELACERYRAGARLRGVDVSVDPDAPRASEQLLELVFELAEDNALLVFDPQLGRTISRADDEQVKERMAQTGIFAAAGLSSLEAPTRVGARASSRLWLVLLASLLAVYGLTRLLRCAI